MTVDWVLIARLGAAMSPVVGSTTVLAAASPLTSTSFVIHLSIMTPFHFQNFLSVAGKHSLDALASNNPSKKPSAGPFPWPLQARELFSHSNFLYHSSWYASDSPLRIKTWMNYWPLPLFQMKKLKVKKIKGLSKGSVPHTTGDAEQMKARLLCLSSTYKPPVPLLAIWRLTTLFTFIS